MRPARVTTGSRDRLVGRSDHVALLDELCERVVRGEGAAVSISGEPGIGKSLMLRIAEHAARDRGITALAGACSNRGGAPYEPWRQIVEAYLDHFSRNELMRRLGSNAAHLSALVPGLPTPTSTLSRLGLSPATVAADRRDRLHAALATLLGSHDDEQPLLVAIDDLHWASTQTIDALLNVARAVERAAVILLVAYRSAAHGPAAGSASVASVVECFMKHPNYVPIELHGLTTGECASMIRRIAGHRTDAEYAARVARVTGGNPLYVQELARSIPNGGTPGGVRENVAARLAELSPLGRQVVVAQAVLGGRSGRRALRARFASVDEARLREAIGEALTHGLLEDDDTPAGGYRFRHEIVREGVLASCGRARIASEHAAAVETTDLSPVSASAGEVARLAWHCLGALSALPAETVARWVGRAARVALDSFAPEEAERLIEPVVEADEQGAVQLDLAARAELHLLLARAAFDRDREEKLIAHLCRAYDAYEAAGRDDLAVEVALTPAYERLGSGTGDRWILAHRGVAALRLRAERLVTPATGAHARLLAQRGERPAFEAALESAESLGDPDVLLAVLVRFAYYEILDGRPREAGSLNVRAVGLAHRLGHADALFWCRYTDIIGLMMGSAGDHEAALAEMAGAAESLGSTKLFSIAHRCRGQLHAAHGRFASAAESLEEASGLLARHRGSFQTRAIHTVREIVAVERAGDPDAAVASHPLLVTLYSARESGDRELWEKTLHLADAAENPGPPLTFRWGSLAVRALAVSALRVRIRARALVLECASLSGYFLPFFPGLLGLPADLYRAELHSSLGEDEEAVAWYAAAVTLCRERARLPALAWSLLHAAAFAAKLASAGSQVSVAAIAEAADPSAQQPGSTPRRVVASGAASQRDEPGSQATLTLAHSLVNAADAVAAEVGMGFLAKVARAFRETLASNAWGEQISSRELEVLRLVSSGFTNADIANMLHISANTVAKHVRSILAKTGAANRAEAAVLASERGLL